MNKEEVGNTVIILILEITRIKESIVAQWVGLEKTSYMKHSGLILITQSQRKVDSCKTHLNLKYKLIIDQEDNQIQVLGDKMKTT